MNTRALVFIVLGLIVAAALFAVLRPAGVSGPETPLITQSPTGPAVPIAHQPPSREDPEVVLPPPVANSFDFVIKRGERVAGPVAMQVREGEDVEIKVTSDEADELHLHGYDLHTPVKPNQPIALYFKATHSGRFELELHKSGVELGTLAVMPH
jgi:hypothetical protein